MYYSRYATIATENGVTTVEVSKAFKIAPSWLRKEFYASFLRDALPASSENASIELYEKRKDFYTYKVTFNDPNSIIKIH